MMTGIRYVFYFVCSLFLSHSPFYGQNLVFILHGGKTEESAVYMYSFHFLQSM